MRLARLMQGCFAVLVCAVSVAAAPLVGLADEIQHVQLTDVAVENFIKAQTDLAAVAPKIQDAGEQPDPALQAELEKIATDHGFKNFAELDTVAANISMVMSGLDNDSNTYVDPVEALKKELADVQADTDIPESDKKQLVDELNEAIKTSTPLKYPENVDVVKKHQAELEKALE